MGYVVETYHLDWPVLEQVLRQGDTALRAQVRENAASTGMSQDAIRRGLRVEQAIESLVGGGTGKALAGSVEGTVRDVPNDIALAFAALVRTIGTRSHELIHSMAAGRRFRDEFLRGKALDVFPGAPLEHLIGRPLIGIERRDFPYFGGLTRQEVADVLGELTIGDLPEWDNTDEAEWLHQLFLSLESARDAGRDIVSLYL